MQHRALVREQGHRSGEPAAADRDRPAGRAGQPPGAAAGAAPVRGHRAAPQPVAARRGLRGHPRHHGRRRSLCQHPGRRDRAPVHVGVQAPVARPRRHLARPGAGADPDQPGPGADEPPPLAVPALARLPGLGLRPGALPGRQQRPAQRDPALSGHRLRPGGHRRGDLAVHSRRTGDTARGARGRHPGDDGAPPCPPATWFPPRRGTPRLPRRTSADRLTKADTR